MKLSPSNLLTFFVLAYYILTMMFPARDDSLQGYRIFPQITMGIICIYCLWIAINKSRILLQVKLFQPFFALMLMGFVYVFFSESLANIANNFLGYLTAFMSILFMFTLYIHLDTDEQMAKRNIYFIFLMQIIFAFYHLWQDLFMGYAVDMRRGGIHDSHAGFILECCLPFTLILPIKRLRLYTYIILFLGTIYCGQRTAALVAIATLPFGFSYLRQSIKKSDIAILSILFAIAIIPIATLAINNLLARHEYDMRSGSVGSGRQIFWAIIWRHFWDNDLLYILFGNGYGSVQSLLKRTYGMAILSHNGWLDYMYIYGIGGLFLFIKTLVSLISANKKINSVLSQYKNILLIIFILFIVKCSGSHGNWDISVMPIAMTLAIIMHDYTKVETEKEDELEDMQDDTIEVGS